MKNNLNKRDEDTLNFIKAFMIEHNVTPTIRDITDGLGVTSVAATYAHFKRLIAQGYIIPYENNTGKNTRYAVKGMRFVEDKRRVKKAAD